MSNKVPVNFKRSGIQDHYEAIVSLDMPQQRWNISLYLKMDIEENTPKLSLGTWSHTGRIENPITKGQLQLFLKLRLCPKELVRFVHLKVLELNQYIH
jgi:hypothetical protein